MDILREEHPKQDNNMVKYVIIVVSVLGVIILAMLMFMLFKTEEPIEYTQTVQVYEEAGIEYTYEDYEAEQIAEAEYAEENDLTKTEDGLYVDANGNSTKAPMTAKEQELKDKNQSVIDSVVPGNEKPGDPNAVEPPTVIQTPDGAMETCREGFEVGPEGKCVRVEPAPIPPDESGLCPPGVEFDENGECMVEAPVDPIITPDVIADAIVAETTKYNEFIDSHLGLPDSLESEQGLPEDFFDYNRLYNDMIVQSMCNPDLVECPPPIVSDIYGEILVDETVGTLEEQQQTALYSIFTTTQWEPGAESAFGVADKTLVNYVQINHPTIEDLDGEDLALTEGSMEQYDNGTYINNLNATFSYNDVVYVANLSVNVDNENQVVLLDLSFA